MQATKILWGQIIVVLSIVLLTMWSATEWTAWELGFQPQLGPPWFEVLHIPFYPPPIFFWWWFAYNAYAPSIFIQGAYIASSGGIIAAAAAIAMSVWRAREAKNVETYGSARWAAPKEIEKAGLLGPDGVVLGRYRRAYLRHDGPEHVLCFAPTRSGKGVGLVIPREAWPRPTVRSDQRQILGLQSPSGSPPWRMGGARCPEYRRHPGRSGRQPREAQPLGEDQPRAAGRRHPARPLCREGQDARRGGVLPLGPEAAD